MQFFTDATPSGFGGYYDGKWFCGKFDHDIIPADCKASMTLFELYPVVMAVALWSKNWQRKRILVNCDNVSTTEIINQHRSKIPFIMKFVRKLVWLQLQFNFVIRARAIPGSSNLIADAISRFQIDKFRQLAQQADRLPTTCLPASDLMLF